MKRTEKAEFVSVICSVFMAVAMIVVARLTGSVGILAEGIDTVVDVVASLAVIAGMRLSERHTRSFPQGLYKLENMVALVIGVLIILSAYELARESIGRLTGEGEPITQPWLVIGVMAGVVVITGFTAWYKNKVGKEENSPSLQADAKHSWTDVLASAAVAAGVALQMAGIPHMDSIAALVVVAALGWSGIQVTKEGLAVLLDASIEKDVLDEIRQYAEATPGVRRIASVEGRNSGSYRFVKLAVIPTSAVLTEVEKIEESLKRAIHDHIEHVDRIDVEFFPEPGRSVLAAAPVSEDGTTLSPSFGDAPRFALLELSEPDRKIVREEIVANPAKEKPEGRDIAAAVFLAKQGVGRLMTGKEDPAQAALWVLDANGIRVVRLSEGKNIQEVRKHLESM